VKAWLLVLVALVQLTGARAQDLKVTILDAPEKDFFSTDFIRVDSCSFVVEANTYG